VAAVATDAEIIVVLGWALTGVLEAERLIGDRAGLDAATTFYASGRIDDGPGQNGVLDDGVVSI
jgi:hypothetical protein